MAEWLTQRFAKPRTLVQFQLRPHLFPYAVVVEWYTQGA